LKEEFFVNVNVKVKVNGCWWMMEDRRWEMGRFKTKKPGHGEREMLASLDGAASLFRPYRA